MKEPRFLASVLVVLAAAFGLTLGAGATSAAAAELDLEGFNKVFTCTACHGPAGNSRSDAMPIIAGLDAAYFRKQIENYAAGRRVSPEMEPYGKYVLNVGVGEAAAYFARQRRERSPIKVDAAAAARGRGASAPCVICHGPAGRGDVTKLIPSLAGQPPGYLREQMLLFKQNRRSPGDEALKAMKALMATISDETFGDLAAYYSGLQP
jgi:cytochrome c553